MIVVQYRNRRTGLRRTFQISEILPDSSANVLMQFDIRKDVLRKISNSKSLIKTITLFTGFSNSELLRSLKEKESVLKWMVSQKIDTVDTVGRVMAEYYTNKDLLMGIGRKNKAMKV